jgi:hypothetical protein
MGQLFCTVSIKVGDEWVGKSDSGIVTADNEKIDLEMTQKGSASDAFKRACVKWGIGRFLYDLDIQRVDKQVYLDNQYRLTEYINGIKDKKPETKTTYKPDTAKAEYTGTHVCTKCKEEVVVPNLMDSKFKVGEKWFKCPRCGGNSQANPKKETSLDNPPF